MRAIEEKEVDEGEFELGHPRENELEREHEDELPAVAVGQQLDARREGVAIDAMCAILDRRVVVVDTLRLPKRQLEALHAFKAAVEGRDGDLSQFVYASDRKDLLEQSLAVLQPELMREFDHTFANLVHRVGQLRLELRSLEQSQHEHHDAHREVGLVEDAETAAPPKPDADTSLDGPERVVAKPASSLTGPELAEPNAAPSTLAAGPELTPAAKGPTTLGDVAEIEAAHEALEPQQLKPVEATVPEKKSWWRRAFGKD